MSEKEGRSNPSFPEWVYVTVLFPGLVFGSQSVVDSSGKLGGDSTPVVFNLNRNLHVESLTSDLLVVVHDSTESIVELGLVG